MLGHRLLLIGGGHAHLGVLADWIRRGRPDGELTLLSPDRHTRYSGMIPGTVSGKYDRDTGLIDLAPLARRAGVDLVLDRCIAIDPEGRMVDTAGGRRIAFDLCSIDTGGVGMAREELGTDPRLLDVRPIGTFLTRLDRVPDGAVHHVAVIGGGAGGVELAFALRHRRADPPLRVTLVAGAAGVLAGFAPRARKLATRALAAQGITLVKADARFKDEQLDAGGHSLEPVDQVLAALGAAAPEWPGASGLAVDDHGFIKVDRNQRSVSHPQILAAGDVAARQDRHVPRSGVHAVHTGPVLATNLRHLLNGNGTLHSYTPRRATLYLLATADGKAIASYGRFAAHGRWAAWLKRAIDRQWVTSFAKLGRDV